MQILLQALFAETSEGKRPDTIPSDREGSDPQAFFADFFFSDGDDSAFSELEPPEDLSASLEANNQTASFPPEVEVLLPDLDVVDDHPDPPGLPMIDITPEQLAEPDKPILPGHQLPRAGEEPLIFPISQGEIANASPDSAGRHVREFEGVTAGQKPSDKVVAKFELVRAQKNQNSRDLPNLPEQVRQVAPDQAPGAARPAISDAAAVDSKTAENSETRDDTRIDGVKSLHTGRADALPTARADTVQQQVDHPLGDRLSPASRASLDDGDKPAKSAEIHSFGRERSDEVKLAPRPQPAQPAAPSASTAATTPIQPLAFIDRPSSGDASGSVEPIAELGARDTGEVRQQVTVNPRSETAPLARPVVNQVMQMVTRANLDGLIEVRLQPEELGRVRLAMNQIEAGVTVHITAERQETLELLRRNIDMLENDLRDQGFENPSFTFGQGGADTLENGDDAPPQSAQSSEEPDRPRIQVDVVSQTLSGDDGRLDIRL